MRLLVLLTAALALAPTVSSSSDPGEGTDLAVTILRVEGAGATITWTAAPGAIAYHVYRGPDLDSLEFIGTTVAAAFRDASPPDATVWYLITTGDVEPGYADRRGACISQRGHTGISVTVSHCTPTNFP